MFNMSLAVYDGHYGIDEKQHTDDELIYAATSRCQCGAGLAYVKGCGAFGDWECSAILTGRATIGSTHDQPRPFAFWKVLGEEQPSAQGQTTRPRPTPSE